MNRKRSGYNIVIGIGSQMISLILGILIPRLFLVNLGSEVNGFINSIGQFFSYFALLEAGVGAAALQALYGPIAAQDRRKISEIFLATERNYKRTSIFYFIAVIGLAVIYPAAVDSNIPTATMVLIILFHGIPGVISYYFQGKYLILLQAEGKNYIVIALTSIASTATSVLKIILLFCGFDIIPIQFTYLVFDLLKIGAIAFYVRRNYGWIDREAEPDPQAIGQKNAAFINQICDLIFRNTDTIILTVFCDLKVVSVYAMYSMLFSMIRTALDHIAKGLAFVMGQTYNQDINRYRKLHDLYEAYRMALIFALYNIALIFIIPFMKLYTAGIEDINYIDGKVALLFAVYYLLTGARACSSDLINYAQHFKKTQSRCIAEALINLTVSLAAVRYWGIYGVLLGTIAALLYRMNDMILYANRKILNRGAWIAYKKVISNSAAFILITAAASLIPWRLDSYGAIIGWACVAGIIICGVYFAIASLVNREQFRMLRAMIGPYVSGKLRKAER